MAGLVGFEVMNAIALLYFFPFQYSPMKEDLNPDI
jgi:hypothetical protein